MFGTFGCVVDELGRSKRGKIGIGAWLDKKPHKKGPKGATKGVGALWYAEV